MMNYLAILPYREYVDVKDCNERTQSKKVREKAEDASADHKETRE
jgi:hypothetical protein